MDHDDDTEERACIISEACGVSYERALQLAKEQAAEEARKKLGNRGWQQRELIR